MFDEITVENTISVTKKFFKAYYRIIKPLTVPDEVILGLLHDNGGTMLEENLGVLLGFSVTHKPQKNIYKDPAEVKLFQSFLNKLSDYNLIEINNEKVKVTYWGKKAFAKREKYTFHAGLINVFSFGDLELSNKEDVHPFNKLGINTKLTSDREVKPLEIHKSDKSKREKKLEKNFLKNYQGDPESIILDKIECENFVDIEEITVPISIRIQIDTEGEMLSFFKGDNNLGELTKLIHLESNDKVYTRFEKYAKYKLYLKESDELSIKELLKFGRHVNWWELLSDERMIWDQSSIEALNNANVITGDEWKKVSENCPVHIIQKSLDRFEEFWYWPLLSERLPEEHVLANLRNYPWDEYILAERLEGKNLEEFLLNREHKDQFEWDQVNSKLDDTFIYDNFEQINIDASYLSTENKKISKLLIPEYSEKKWDWEYISAEYDLEFISQNSNKLLEYLDPVILIKRYFNSSKKLSDDDIEKSIAKIRVEEPTFRVSCNTEIKLTADNLDILENSGLLFWGTADTPGVEANQNFVWTDELFEEYGNKIKSNEGFSHVSQTISPTKVIAYEDFNWDYDILSERDRFVNDFSTLRKLYPKLNLDKVLRGVSSSILVNNLFFFLSHVDNDEEKQVLSDVLSDHVELYKLCDHIKRYDLYSFKFNWSAIINGIPSEYLERSIKDHQNTLNNVNNSKSFWSAASKQVDLDFILGNPQMKWDWEFLTKKTLPERDLQDDEFRSQYAAYIYWPHIISEVIPIGDLANTSVLESIAKNLTKTGTQAATNAWTVLTKILPPHLLWDKIDQTLENDLFKWDWDFISNSEKIKLEKTVLNKYADKLNWEYLSRNDVLKKFFDDSNKDVYVSVSDWRSQVQDYLNAFEQYWDFKELSKISNITWDESLVEKFSDQWDWKVLSSEKCRLLKARNELIPSRIKKFKSYVDWEILSSREDIKISQKIVQKFSDESWNWKALSQNSEFSFDDDFLIEHHEKEWDWETLSDRKNISNKSLSKLSDVSWNWTKISNRDDLVFNKKLLSILKEKDEVDWEEIPYRSKLEITSVTLQILDSNGALDEKAWDELSGHKNLDFNKNSELLEIYRNKWNWEILVRYDKIDINNFSLLQKHKSELNWFQVSSHSSFEPTEDILSNFKERLDWNAITKKIDITIYILNQYKDYLNWSIVSSSKRLEFTPQLIEKYEDYWDWYELDNNPSLLNECREIVNNKINDTPELRFYFKIKDQGDNWAGSIYHFTHLTNALKIIETRKILSRNKAIGKKFADAAGSVVNRRDTSHDFARFYFRPQTPTQFYNENLGKDYTDEDYFLKAKTLGLPKCPIPIFFKFDLQEILLKNPEKCYISNGNMQSNWAKFGPIKQMMSRFKYEDLFSTVYNTSDDNFKTYLNCSQQEFLIQEELDFSGVNNFDIIAPTKEDKKQLKRLLSPDTIAEKISVDTNKSMYHRKNRSINYSFEDGVFEISSDYEGNGSRSGTFIVELDDSAAEIISGSISHKEENKIFAYPDLKLSVTKNESFRVLFRDNIKNTEWEVFKTSPAKKNIIENPSILKKYSANSFLDELIDTIPHLENNFGTKVRHYTLYEHTSLVLKCFNRYFSQDYIPVDTSLFKTLLALHDIGKPIAFKKGNKNDQHKYTQRIIKSIWDDLPYSNKDLSLILALTSGDHLGNYFQGKQTLSSTQNAIKNLTNNTEEDVLDFLYLYMVYYECDIAAYTADEGGIEFLEHLFEYDNGDKIFNKREMLIQLKPKIWSKYFNLRKSLKAIK